MLVLYKERLQIPRESYSASNIEYIEADDKTFPEGQYDLIFANTVIHWIQDKRAMFEKVYDNLKSEGQFAFVTFDGVPVDIALKVLDLPLKLSCHPFVHTVLLVP